jgi:Trypsin-like peptidase domain/Tetratricopeptide Repeats-Sensor
MPKFALHFLSTELGDQIMAWDSDSDLGKLTAALEAHDKAATSAFCNDLIARIYKTAEPYPLNPAKKLLSALRKRRFFEQMERLADAFIQTGAGSNTVRRLYVQALLDQGHFTAALLVLERLIAETESVDLAENAEAKGLMGRAYKQLYVNATAPAVKRNQKWLDEAATAYYGPYRLEPKSYAWHGINVVAVAHRSVRDNVPLAPELPLPATLACEILERIESKDATDSADHWDYGTAVEASVALGRSKDALNWARKYVKDQKADAFEFSSTLRQLEEVWGLPCALDTENKKNEEAILSLLRATILEREGGDIQKSGKDVRSELTELRSTNLERVFGVDRFFSLDWYRRGLARCAGVARIGREPTQGVGTGFLLMGVGLHPMLGDELYLLTNSHVVSPGPEVPIAMRPADAVVTFEGLPGAEHESWTVKKLIFNSPIRELDATLLQLDRTVPDVEPYPIAPALPDREAKRRVYVVGHPLGGGVSFSLHDNLLLDWDQRLVHYRTPTEPGSSGSPVFDDQWRLIAIHHAGGPDMRKLNGQPGTYEANEGIRILAIVEEMRRQLSVA